MTDPDAIAAFMQRYGATLFDADDPRDRAAEAARRRLITAFVDMVEDPQHQDVLTSDVTPVGAGLMVGIACVMAAMGERTVETDRNIRSGLTQLIPWAVDMMRSIDGLPPLD